MCCSLWFSSSPFRTHSSAPNCTTCTWLYSVSFHDSHPPCAVQQCFCTTPLFPPFRFPPELIHGRKPGAVDALQLCSLLLPQTNWLRLHRVLRLINKAGGNTQLQLSKSQTNRQVVSASMITTCGLPGSNLCTSLPLLSFLTHSQLWHSVHLPGDVAQSRSGLTVTPWSHSSPCTTSKSSR